MPMHDEPILIICVRHRVLGWLPGSRWHLHLTKPVHQLGASDFDVIEQFRELRWWTVTELGTSPDRH